jgi:hypothetical protein
MDQGGNAVMVWQRLDGTTTACGDGQGGCTLVEARVRSAAGTLSAPQALSAFGEPPSSSSGGPQVAIDRSGNAVFAWAIFDGTPPDYPVCCSLIQARARSATGVLSGTQTLSRAGRFAFDAQVSANQSGEAIFAWLATDGTPGHLRVQTRARSAVGALSAVQILSAPGHDAVAVRAGIDQGGNAVFIWQLNRNTTDCGATDCYAVQARARSATGVLSTTQALTDPAYFAHSPRVGVDPSGDAVFVYGRYDGTGGCDTPWAGCSRIEARTRSASGTLGGRVFLSDPGQRAFNPQVGVDEGGDAVAAWSRFGGANWRVQAATGP